MNNQDSDIIKKNNKSSSIIERIEINMLSNMRLCSNVPAQSIVQTALGGYQSVKNYIVPGGRIYEQREATCSELEKIDGCRQ